MAREIVSYLEHPTPCTCRNTQVGTGSDTSTVWSARRSWSWSRCGSRRRDNAVLSNWRNFLLYYCHQVWRPACFARRSS